MAVQHANRGIVKKDLQLYYNREFLKSFRGEPTTNLVFGDYDSFENAVSTYYPANATAVRSTAFSYFGNYSLKASRSSTGADAMLDMESIIPVRGSTVYTYSCANKCIKPAPKMCCNKIKLLLTVAWLL